MRNLLRSSSILTFFLLSTPSNAAFQTTLIPPSVFDNYKNLEEHFNYLYPWGATHNGGAKMVGNSSYHENIYVKDSTLYLKSEPAHISDRLKYYSGTVHSKQTFKVKKKRDVFTLEASFLAPTAKGTWPAFWLNAATSWPPEIDVAEWKGTGKISFNTFNASNSAETLDVDYPNPTQFHRFKCTVEAEDDSNVVVKFWLDGSLKGTQYGHGYVNAGLILIIDLQMLGSSGAPGPTTTTLFGIKDLLITYFDS